MIGSKLLGQDAREGVVLLSGVNHVLLDVCYLLSWVVWNWEMSVAVERFCLIVF